MSVASSPPRRAVLFDLDDTLVPWHTVAHWQWAWRPQGPVLSERHTQAAIRRSLHHWDRRRWEGLVGAGPPTTADDLREALRAELFAIAAHPLPTAETEAVVDRFLRPAGEGEAFADAAPTLAALAERGVRLGVVTDLPLASARRALARAALPEDLLVLHGDDAEARLPSAAAFRRAAARLDVKPRGCLYVGDLFWSDVRAAARAGFASVLLDRTDALARVTGTRVRSLAEVPGLLAAPAPASAMPGPDAAAGTGP